MTPITCEDLKTLRTLLGRASPRPWVVEGPLYNRYGCWHAGPVRTMDPDDAKLVSLLLRHAPSLIELAEQQLDPEGQLLPGLFA